MVEALAVGLPRETVLSADGDGLIERRRVTSSAEDDLWLLVVRRE